MNLTYKIITIFVLITLTAFITSSILKVDKPVKHVIKHVTIKPLKDRNWEKLISSIIFIESTNNDKAVNIDSCVGCLQISSIYVREVNRILKLKHIEKAFDLSDRYDRSKSIEMFTIIQDKKNPKHDFHKAIRLHNPTAGKWYENRIMEHFNKLTIL